MPKPPKNPTKKKREKDNRTPTAHVPGALSPDKPGEDDQQAAAEELEGILSVLAQGDGDNARTSPLVAARILHQFHQGPLPSPERLREYEDALPGLAERIVRLTEREQKHRHKLEQAELAFLETRSRSEARRLSVGQFAGIGITFLLVSAAIYFGCRGNWSTAALFLAAPFLEAVRRLVQPRTRTDAPKEQTGPDND